jgi:serine/threonine-protein kinase
MIRFDLLGEIRLRAPDGQEVDALLRQPKRLALLAYLASPAPGTWHRRDLLTAIFWPDLDTARARSSLRNALYTLRQTLGDAVVLSRGDEEVAIDPSRLTTDVADVWSALHEGCGETALSLYRGELLPGVFPPGSDGFERWLEEERARLRREVAAAGAEWATALEREHRLADALAPQVCPLLLEPALEPVAARREHSR